MIKNTPMMIRMAHPMAFAAFLDRLGASVPGYFRRQGLPALCRDSNTFVPLGRAWGLFADAAEREGPELPWHVGKSTGENALHAGSLRAIAEGPTLYQGLQKFLRMINAEASHLRLGLIEGKKEVLLYTTGYFNLKDERGFDGSQAYQLEVYIAIIRHFAGSEWQPRKLGICASSVPKLVYQRYPECRVRLRQPFSYIAIPRELLHRPPIAALNVPDNPARLVLTDRLDFAESLALLINPYLPQGYPSIRFAASLVDSSVRTLSRRLSGSGTTYQAVIDELRFERASTLLRETDEPIRDIAAATGFKDQGNFSRLFRRIAGVSPREYRQQFHH